MKKLCATLVAAGLTVSSCSGQATSTDDSTATSIAPLTRMAATTAVTEPANSYTAGQTSTVQPLPSAARLRAVPTSTNRDEDQGAREISGVPTTTVEQSPADTTYLAALTAAGITVDGAQDELIAAGHAACANATSQMHDVTLKAVAGQLIAQKRSTLSADQLVSVLSSASRAAYCAKR